MVIKSAINSPQYNKQLKTIIANNKQLFYKKHRKNTKMTKDKINRQHAYTFAPWFIKKRPAIKTIVSKFQLDCEKILTCLPTKIQVRHLCYLHKNTITIQ